MSREGFIGSLQEGTRDAQITMARRLDLNFPPPEQNMDLSDTFVGSNTPAMQFQPQRANNVQFIDDEISIVSQTVFSEARKKRLRNRQGPQIMNENMGFHPGCVPMSNEYMEVRSSYGQMPLAEDMLRNAEWTNVPISIAPDPSDICINLQVTGRVEVTIENDVPKEEQASLSCPICISPLCESTTTKCGHVFCKACIEAAIKAQHKCPTCRRKLKKNDILRIYLPSSV